MKDSEFIELLNLYLDHEISAADAARLESEVQSNPNRRRVYQDYCRMQKACKLLATDFATEPSAADEKVVAFENARTRQASHRRQWYVAGTFAAAAACVAAVFAVRHNQSAATPANDVAQSTPAVVPAVIPSAPAQVLAVSETTPRVPGASATNSLSIRNSREDALAITTRATDPQFVWMQNIQLAPIPQQSLSVEPLRFDVNPNGRTDNRTYSSRQPLPSDVQWTAIRFQR